jgi:aromatic ring-cleaving dioxygenase
LIAARALATAEVVRVQIERREDVLNGRSFDTVGPYEKIIGKVYFAFDPGNPMNARIVDLDKVTRNKGPLRRTGTAPCSSPLANMA